MLAAVTFATVPHLGRWFLGNSGARPAEKALFLLVVLLAASTAADLIGTEDILS